MIGRKLKLSSYDDVIQKDLYKYSPYVSLTDKQYEASNTIINDILKTLSKSNDDRLKGISILQAPAGTGKTILAVYLMYILNNIKQISMNTHTGELNLEDSVVFDYKDMIDRQDRKLRIGLVLKMKSMRTTLGEVFKKTNGLAKNLIYSPYEAAGSKEFFDVLIVDECHRLCQRKNLSCGWEYDSFDRYRQLYGETQLDWLTKKCRHLVLMYDPEQSVRESDITSDQFDNTLNLSYARIDNESLI